MYWRCIFSYERQPDWAVEGWSDLFELGFRVMTQCYGTGNEVIFKRVILTGFVHNSIGKESAVQALGPEFISSGSQLP